MSSSQTISIKGKVTDGTKGIFLSGVNISVEGTTKGTTTNANGEFDLSVSNVRLPFNLIFTYVGFIPKKLGVPTSSDNLLISLEEDIILGKEIVVSASRIEESILRSPVSIEKIGIADIKQSSASNFYDGLYSLKGVDMTVHGLTFRIPNTRGFNGNTSIRLNQFVDGVDNAPPGLSFAAGNIFGLNQIDVESVELLVGASSALYGPGGSNGALLMTSKNPFDYQGLSASYQLGIMHLGANYRDSPAPFNDLNLRYAKSFGKMAFKISAGYLQAIDWNASDFRDRTDLNNKNLTRSSNEGYDGVNVYGDDIVVPVNLKDVAPSVAAGVAASQGIPMNTQAYTDLYNTVISLFPDQVISRTGFREKELVDYGTRNLRLNGAFHYKINPKLEFIAQVGYGNGTSVYTTTNRFSLKNFEVYSGKLELKGSNFYVRTYGVGESSGDSYDAGATAQLINEAWKPSEKWYADYIGAFAQHVLLGNPQASAFKFARLVADNRDEFGTQFSPGAPTLPLPGSAEFNAYLNDIRSRPVNQGGSKVIDESKLWHTEGLYNFGKKIRFIELVVGGSYRLYSINSQGTIFADRPGEPISINQFGAFAQASRKFFQEKLKVVAAGRYDKNEYFKGQFTPRFTVVFAADRSGERNFRASAQTAFRFPTIANQWVNLNAGPYRVIGGLPQVQKLQNFDTVPVYPLSGKNPISDLPVTKDGPFVIPTFGPEIVTSFELGYKGLHFGKLVLFDGYVYRNIYSGFEATQTLAQYPGTPQERRFQTTITTDFPIITYGWAIGADVLLPRGFLVKGNINNNNFSAEGRLPVGFQSGFNTPAYRGNLSLTNSRLYKNIGFNVNWRWQESFLWESNFGVSQIPAFATLDASVSYKMKKLNSSVKLGASNLTNNYYLTNLGSAQIGGLYYVTWSLDDILKK